MKKHGILVLVRHGESRFNQLNLFTGWIDSPLSKQGLKEAHRVAKHCKNFDYDTVFTSHLERAHETLLVILSEQKKIGVFQHESDHRYDSLKNISSGLKRQLLPVYTAKDLNERAYGTLQGMNKNEAVKIHSRTMVSAWRRSFDAKPPKGESLKDVFKRTTAYFEKNIHPRVKHGETILVVAHGNTLRAIIKFLERVNDQQISYIDLPFAKPLVYTCINNKFKRIEGTYSLKRPLR